MVEPMGQEEVHAPRGGVFATTHWSVVRAAGEVGSAESQSALESLCLAYWPCIYAFVRRLGQDSEAARDCTQAFFARLLEKNWIARADRARGRFRTFLLTALKGFMADEWDRGNAQKRGGGRVMISLDAEESEAGYQCAPADALMPDRLYDRHWAMAVFRQALDRLAEECSREGKQRAHEVLKGFVGGGGPALSYADAAAQLGCTEAKLPR